MAANGISTLPSKYLRQKAKLELAKTERTADGNPRDSYDITELPTQYANTIVLLKSSTSATMTANSSEYTDIVVNYSTGPIWSTTNPFTPSTGGSMIFGAANSYLSIPGRNDFAIGTGDVTVEWWQYQTSLATLQYPRVWTVGNWPNAALGVSIENGVFYSWINEDYTTVTIDNVINSWNHFAYVRYNGVISIYQNGQLKGSYNNSDNITDNTSSLIIGGESGPNEPTTRFPGRITNFRFISGQAKYKDEFSVPTIPFSKTDTIDNLNTGGLQQGRPWN